MLNAPLSLVLSSFLVVGVPQEPPASPTSPPTDQDVEARIEAYLASWERRGELSGVVLAARGERILFRRAYGQADQARGISNTPETSFHVASVTKTFTAAAILLLADVGSLTLSDPLSTFLPDYPRGKEITLEHLLGHSSGIPDHHRLPGFEEKVAGGISLADLVRWQSTFPLEFEPGSEDRYGNSAFAVLAHVVELVSGDSFPEFVRGNLLEPLGMESTGEVESPGEGAQGYASGPPPSHRIAVPARNYLHAMGSGSMRSTVDDLLLWLRAVDQKTLVDVQRTRWPFGWGKTSYGSFEALDQTGMHDGFTATIAVVPEADLYVVHLSNLQAGLPFQRVHRDLMRILLGMEVELPEAYAPTPWDSKNGARLAGTYESSHSWDPILTANDKGLWWRWTPDQTPQYLTPLENDRFLLVADGCELRFTPVVPGKPPQFEFREPWNPDGPFRTYVRLP